MMKLITLCGLYFLTIFVVSARVAVAKRKSKTSKYYDLSYSINNDTIYYPGQTVDFELHKDKQGLTDRGYWYASFSFCMAEHGGTHVDAPFHFTENGWKLDDIPLDHMVDVPSTVIDVESYIPSSDASPNSFTLQVEHLINHEQEHGQIPFHGVPLIHTGWSKYWPDKVKYLGWDNATSTLNFPGLSEEAAKWLVTERNIVGIGIDTPSVDIGNNGGNLPVHILFAENKIYNIENVANLHLLLNLDINSDNANESASSSCNLHLFVLPIKITGATGGPARILAYCK